MNLLGPLVYHLNVDVIGKSALRFERLKSERKLRRPGFWKHEHINPPLGTSPRLKELISRHYLAGRYYEKKGPVAWVTSGAPMEFLKALDFFLMYPENHGAVCGIRRVADKACAVAEDAGYSRDICSYARTDFGTVLSGNTPVGRLPKPDLLVCCTNICQTVLYWYQVLAHHYKVPLVLIDTPFIYKEVSDHSIRYVEKQLEDVLVTAERVAKKSMDAKRLEQVIASSREAVDLWLAVMQSGKAQPSPITAFDEFIHMAPIVEMRGEQYTVDYYRALHAELSERIASGMGALKHEKKRLIWDNLPIWHRVRPLAEALAEQGVALVGSTYTNAWGELAPLIRPEQGLAGMARVYLHAILNRGTGYKLDTMKRMVKEYSADGVILHSDRSCKPYSIGQIDQRQALGEQLGVPALLLEGDHNDSRALSPAQIDNRLAAFLEMLGT
jgi:bcr-type benzoyl-CoA reductase subunit B